uniref:MFS general substrate transporter n=1 Tax=Discosia rubi TaxID=2502037 RepID=A0A6M6I9J0_9PEZI|nr:MFS general substrate transporter [Discosia rubi]
MAEISNIPLNTIEGPETNHTAVSSSPERNEEVQTAAKYTWLFWMAFVALSLSALVSGLEASIVSTALPTILASVEVGQDYVWVLNIYFLTSAASQPLYSQLADLWGRRWLMICAVAIFAGGSALCGAAYSAAMLITGRGVQGIGAGGINMLVDVIICDLVPLRDRGSIVGLLFAIMSLASSLGPVIGGAMAQAGAWRWIFYMNIPLCGIAIIMLVLFLRVSFQSGLTFKEQLRRIDFVGNGILMGSTTLVQYAVTYAGSRYSWNDPQIIATLTLGLLLLMVFVVIQRSPHVCPNPVVPPRLLSNRTSVAALFISFNHSMLTFWATYFFPIYFQSVMLSTPTRSGIQLLPLVFIFPAAAAIVGGGISRWGRYRPAHFIGLGLISIAFGCSSLMSDVQSDSVWIIAETLVALGLGITIPALLPAVQVELTDADTAASTGMWAFLRSLGTIWGVSIPAAVFNNRFSELLWQIDDQTIKAELEGDDVVDA